MIELKPRSLKYVSQSALVHIMNIHVNCTKKGIGHICYKHALIGWAALDCAYSIFFYCTFLLLLLLTCFRQLH